MAHFVEVWRSNTFTIIDRSAFDAWIALFNGNVACTMPSDTGSPQLVALYQDPMSEDGIPTERWDDATEEEETMDCDFFAELAPHLTPDTVAIFTTAAYESKRYVGGNTTAVRANGDRIHLALTDIESLIQAQWGLIPHTHSA